MFLGFPPIFIEMSIKLTFLFLNSKGKIKTPFQVLVFYFSLGLKNFTVIGF